MGKFIVVTLIFLAAAAGGGVSVPPGWKAIKDAKGVCQIAVPAAWIPGAENTGSAVYQDASVAIAVVTSQQGQTFQPISENMLRLLGVPKDKVFENSATRTFYQDRTSSNSAEQQSSLSVKVPGKGCTCSARVAYLGSVGEDAARKIVLTVGPVE